MLSATTISLVDRIDALLPQTQCTRCGYDGCRPYAEALAEGAAPINRCPPGGAAGIAALATLLGLTEIPLDPACGREGPLLRAVIDEPRCIGCTLCIEACPVDAIVGAPRLMHSIIAADCTGCELCVAPCPMDCIRMETVVPAREWTLADADHARARMLARRERLGAALPDSTVSAAADGLDERQIAIAAAIQRAKARRGRTVTP